MVTRRPLQGRAGQRLAPGVPLNSQKIFPLNKHPFTTHWPELPHRLMAEPVTRKGKEITAISVDPCFTTRSPVTSNVITWDLLKNATSPA